MADVRITALPTAQSPITGDELVPIVQNGLTVQTTVAAITQSPSLTQTFLTVGQQPQLPNSRYFSTGVGLGITDGGAQSAYSIALNGTSGSLETSASGIIAKTAPNTITPRTLTASGNGISVSNGNGVSGDPTFQLTGVAQALANASGTGLLAIGAGSTITPLTIIGEANQISVTNGNGTANPIIGLANNPVLPGTAAVRIPIGTTAERGTGTDGSVRFNSQTGAYEAYSGGIWRDFSLAGGVVSFDAGSTGFSPSSPASGSVVLSGILNSTSGGTGASALTGYLYGNGALAATASTTVPTTDLSGTVSNAQLANSGFTINGTAISLGGSATITATNPEALTIGTGLSGTTYIGSVPATIAIANTAVSAGSYTAANITVNAQGQITAAANGTVGSVTSVSVSAGNGFTGTVASPTTTPTITLATSVTGVVYGNGTALSAATGAQIASAIGSTTITNATNATTLSGGATGSVVYQSAAGTTSFLGIGTAGQVLVAGATFPQYVAQSTLSVGSATSATNATNTAITNDTATATAVYPTWVTANTGDLPQKVTSTKLSFVPSTGALTATGGISGGTF